MRATRWPGAAGWAPGGWDDRCCGTAHAPPPSCQSGWLAFTWRCLRPWITCLWQPACRPCCRSVTILPAALSPHSLASVPSASFGDASFTFSVPRNLSSGSGLGAAHAGLGGEEDEAATAAAFGSESEVSESEADSREPSQHGPAQPGGWLPARPPPRGQ